LPFRTPPQAPITESDLLVDLGDAALLVFLFGERLGLALPLGFLLASIALVRAADPLVDVLDPRSGGAPRRT